MSQLELKAKKREIGRRNPARKAMRAGEVPAIYYTKKENIPLAIDRHLFEKQMLKLKPNTVFNIDVEGERRQAFVRDYSVFLKSQAVQHIDFIGIVEDQPIKVKVPLRHTGLSKGVVKGGVMRRFVSAVMVRCTSDTIPEEIVIDVSQLDIGDYVYISDLAKANEKLTFLEAQQKAVIAVVASRASVTLATDEDASEDSDAGEKEESDGK